MGSKKQSWKRTKLKDSHSLTSRPPWSYRMETAGRPRTAHTETQRPRRGAQTQVHAHTVTGSREIPGAIHWGKVFATNSARISL